VDFIFEEEVSRLNKRKESLSTLKNEEKEHCIYSMKKKEKM
jgi:hypothetical protein